MNALHLPPGGTLGILGGGQMARALVLAARRLGYRTHVLESTVGSACADVADRVVLAAARRVAPAVDLARGCDVVTLATENVPAGVLQAVAAVAPLRPGLDAVEITQDRERERAWLEGAGLTLAPWRAVGTLRELREAIDALGGDCFVKPCLRHRGPARPVRVRDAGDAAAAWLALWGAPAVVEAAVPVDLELAVLVARSASGDVAVYPAATSARDGTTLVWSALPGELPRQLAGKSQQLAAYLARRLDVVGLLTVEMFYLADGRLVVNELVPAPHPAFVATELAAGTGQGEQHVRCVLGLPLGDVALRTPVASAPLTGESWGEVRESRLRRALRIPGVRAQLAGDGPPSAHAAGFVCAEAPTLDAAVDRVVRAGATLEPRRAHQLERPMRHAPHQFGVRRRVRGDARRDA